MIFEVNFMSDKLKISFIVFILALLPFFLMANNKVFEDTSIRRNTDTQITNLLKSNDIREDTEMYGYKFRLVEEKEDVDNEGYTKQLFEVTKGEKTHIWAYKTTNGTDIKYFSIMDMPTTFYELSTNYSMKISYGAMIAIYLVYFSYLYWFAFKRKVEFRIIFGSGFMYFCFCALTPIMLGAFAYTNEFLKNNMIKVVNLNLFLLVTFFNATMIKYFNDLYKMVPDKENKDVKD